jgi:hypothetical protein
MLSETLEHTPPARVASSLVPNIISIAREMMHELLKDAPTGDGNDSAEKDNFEELRNGANDSRLDYVSTCAAHVIDVWRRAVAHCAHVYPHMSGVLLNAILVKWQTCSCMRDINSVALTSTAVVGDEVDGNVCVDECMSREEGVLWALWALDCVPRYRKDEEGIAQVWVLYTLLFKYCMRICAFLCDNCMYEHSCTLFCV